MRGRKPKPTALKLVAGNPGRRRLPKNEPKPKRVIPSPPAHLSETARTAWGSLATRLDRLGLMTEADAEALEALCELYAEIVELRADVRTHGRVQIVKTTSGDPKECVRPSATLLADADRRFRGWMSEFGLTPSARTRVKGDVGEDGNSDPAAAYFG